MRKFEIDKNTVKEYIQQNISVKGNFTLVIYNYESVIIRWKYLDEDWVGPLVWASIPALRLNDEDVAEACVLECITLYLTDKKKKSRLYNDIIYRDRDPVEIAESQIPMEWEYYKANKIEDMAQKWMESLNYSAHFVSRLKNQYWGIPSPQIKFVWRDEVEQNAPF